MSSDPLNVSVRAYEMGDWEDVATLFQAPQCRWGTLQMPYQSKDEIKARLESPPADLMRLVAVDQDSGRVLGLIGLHCNKGRRAHSAMIGMFVHDDYHDRGVGTKLLEAAIEMGERWLNLKRLELTVYTDNARAIHLYEKLGFVNEGMHRLYAYRDGAYVDSYCMARIRE